MKSAYAFLIFFVLIVAHGSFVVAGELKVQSLQVSREAHDRFQISYELQNPSDSSWVFATNVSTPVFRLEGENLVVQMLVHSPPSRLYLGDHFGSQGKVIAPGEIFPVSVSLHVEDFENTPYLSPSDVGLLHKGQKLTDAIASVSRVILRVGFVVCTSEISVSEKREWRSVDHVCGASVEHMQSISVMVQPVP